MGYIFVCLPPPPPCVDIPQCWRLWPSLIAFSWIRPTSLNLSLYIKWGFLVGWQKQSNWAVNAILIPLTFSLDNNNRKEIHSYKLSSSTYITCKRIFVYRNLCEKGTQSSLGRASANKLTDWNATNRFRRTRRCKWTTSLSASVNLNYYYKLTLKRITLCIWSFFFSII